jgi:hypothetical protein
MDQVWYATREDVRSALSSASTARATRRSTARSKRDPARSMTCASADFAPVLDTRYFDWPNPQRARSWRLWLDRDEVISVPQVTSAGWSSRHGLLPGAVNRGPPYNRIETRLDRPSAFDRRPDPPAVHRHHGLFGYRDDRGAGRDPRRGHHQHHADQHDRQRPGRGRRGRPDPRRRRAHDRHGQDDRRHGQTLQTPLAAKKDDVLVHAQDGTAFHRATSSPSARSACWSATSPPTS